MKAKSFFLRIIRYGLLGLIVLAILFLLATGDFSVQALLEFTPEDPTKAAIVLLLLYALKSATIFFPIIVLEIAAGHLFSPLVRDRVMEMWKTAAYADGKPIHSLWKRTSLSHRSVNSFPTATPDQAVYAHSHNACCCEYPSYPFLSNIRKQVKQDKKRAGVQPSDEPKSCTPVLCLW